MLKSALLYFVFLLFLSPDCRAQTHKGVATYLLKTELGFINSELDFNDSSSLFIFGRTGMDTGVLTHSSMNVRGDIMKDADDDAENRGMSVFVAPYDSTGCLIYRNFRTKEITTRAVKLPPMDAYTVTDNWLTFNWKIEPVFDTISGYGCQKATGYFRGRYYTAWFAPGIPVPYGPWKLFGLPGLVVLAYDQDTVFYAALTSLSYPCDQLKTPIEKPEEPKNMTLKEYVYYKDHYVEEMVKVMNKKLPKGMHAGNVTRHRTIREERNHSFEKIF